MNKKPKTTKHFFRLSRKHRRHLSFVTFMVSSPDQKFMPVHTALGKTTRLFIDTSCTVLSASWDSIRDCYPLPTVLWRAAANGRRANSWAQCHAHLSCRSNFNSARGGVWHAVVYISTLINSRHKPRADGQSLVRRQEPWSIINCRRPGVCCFLHHP